MAGMLAAAENVHRLDSAHHRGQGAWDYADYARSWLNGARMLVQTGTTTVADIEAVPDLLPEVWDATPLACFFVSGNDRHSRPARAARRPARGG